ncbi:cysteine hydrolase family protein [Candidatus Woesearchaeota archaeon]|nr:cysteine hydrolase family protein [Candidatus Woesearchaeota archaeon]
MKNGIYGLIGLLGFACQEDFEIKYEREQIEKYEKNSQSSLDSLEEKNKWGIIIVDMQETFLKYIPKKEVDRIVKNQQMVLNAAEKYDVPVLVFEYWGSNTIEEISDLVKEVPRYEFMKKERDDGFERYGNLYREEDPRRVLDEWGVDTAYFMGVNTDACIVKTADSARRLDYIPVTSKDVVAAQTCNGECEKLAPAYNFFIENGILLDKKDLVIIDMKKENL